MLSRRDFERIAKEMGGIRGVDSIEFLRRTSPWFDPLEPSIRRTSESLHRLGIFHVLHGLRALPLYNVPHISREIRFAVKAEEGGLDVKLREVGFKKLLENRDSLKILDLQNNRVIELLYGPRPLDWDDEVVERAREKMGIRILSVEDYVVSLIAEVQSTMRLELAAKVIYSNIDDIDREYLRMRAARFSVDGVVRELLSGLEEASSR